MNKNTGRQTVTTTNFASYRSGLETASHVWTSAEKVGMEFTLDLMIRSFQEDDLDAQGYHRPAEVFEFEFPGQRVIVFMYDGEVQTVITVEDAFTVRLVKAVRREHPVTIGYTKSYDGETTVRTVEPTSIKFTKSGDIVLGGRDRKTGEYRSFRLDRISSVTVHRSRFVIDEEYITRTAAAREAKMVREIQQTAVRVVVGPQGYTGTTSPESAAHGGMGWSVVVRLDDQYAAVSPTATIRAGLDRLDVIPGRVTTEEAFRALAAGRARSTSYSPIQRAAWRTLSKSWS